MSVRETGTGRRAAPNHHSFPPLHPKLTGAPFTPRAPSARPAPVPESRIAPLPNLRSGTTPRHTAPANDVAIDPARGGIHPNAEAPLRTPSQLASSPAAYLSARDPWAPGGAAGRRLGRLRASRSAVAPRRLSLSPASVAVTYAARGPGLGRLLAARQRPASGAGKPPPSLTPSPRQGWGERRQPPPRH